MDLEKIIEELQVITRCVFSPGDILFLDEIQEIPTAITALRYFYEERPELAVIAAGSLLEITLTKAQISMPVGRVEFLYLGPMTFKEYCLALGEDYLVEVLESYTLSKTFSEIAHNKLLKLHRNYLLVGGMPEAVKKYRETRKIGDAQNVHSMISEAYRNDFSQYASQAELTRLHTVFDQLPSIVGNKVKYSQIDPNQKSRDVKAALDLLVLAQLAAKVSHSQGSGIPLRAQVNHAIYKTYMIDCGMMSTFSGITHLREQDYANKSFLSKGNLAEQFIHQHLLYSSGSNVRPESFYWLREGKQGNAEVDFLLQVNMQIVPVEVKAGAAGSLKSLMQFVGSKGIDLALRFDTNPPSSQTVGHIVKTASEKLAVSARLLSLPLYAVEEARRILEAELRVD